VAVDQAELARLDELDVDQLYVLLAQADPANAEVMFSAEEAREDGRRTFQRLREPLHQRICVEWRYCEKQKTGRFADGLTLTAAVADLIVTVVGGLPAGTVATLTVKFGLNRLCACPDA
jgi:hypothetical protein